MFITKEEYIDRNPEGSNVYCPVILPNEINICFYIPY